MSKRVNNIEKSHVIYNIKFNLKNVYSFELLNL